MAIAETTIIKKMMNELVQAQNNASDQKALKQHVANVKLLSELLLDEKPAPGKVNTDITEEEMKAMLGETGSAKKTKSITLDDDDDANGSSLFDF